MTKLVVLTGAGVSQESGIPTFRDADGLWEGYDVMEVASVEGWRNNPALVLDFYNQRRRDARYAKPNQAHLIIAQLEEYFETIVITQNVDDLHERAGSTHIIHLHGSLFEAKSSMDPSLIYPIEEGDINPGDLCEKGSQLRPNIVWFGEMVPMMDRAADEANSADIFLVVGSSLQVYPAAGLVEYCKPGIPIYIIDPKKPDVVARKGYKFLEMKASEGMEKVRNLLLGSFPS